MKPQQLQDSSYIESNPSACHRLCRSYVRPAFGYAPQYSDHGAKNSPAAAQGSLGHFHPNRHLRGSSRGGHQGLSTRCHSSSQAFLMGFVWLMMPWYTTELVKIVDHKGVDVGVSA